MTDYTPTTALMREWHARADHAGNKSRAEYEAEFDRWLEAHDREVAVGALRDHREGWAGWIEDHGSYVGTTELTQAEIVAVLRSDFVPFGIKAGDSE